VRVLAPTNAAMSGLELGEYLEDEREKDAEPEDT
jgi:hypothetical protein